MIGDRERCLQAGMVSINFSLFDSSDRFVFSPSQDDHITSTHQFFLKNSNYAFINRNFFVFYLFLEPLRRGDLLNAINKLAGERGAQKHHHLIRRPPAITQTYS